VSFDPTNQKGKKNANSAPTRIGFAPWRTPVVSMGEEETLVVVGKFAGAKGGEYADL
jgi:hypothetical protein